LLRQLSEILQNAVRHSDTLARLGGDEFGILMEQCTLAQAQRAVSAIQQTIQDFQFSWEGQSFRIGVSIGLVAISEATPSITELLKQADAACYMAKDLGRNRIHVYNPDETQMVLRQGEMQWVTRINQAIEENRFTLFVQSIVPLHKSTDMHYEFLLRMIGERGEIIPPVTFILAAERYDLMHKLDVWVVEHAFKLLAANPALVEQTHFFSINLSGQSISNAQFLNSVIEQIKELNIDPSKICFEVTETAAISNLRAATHFISSLRELGCQFALDDFGSGLSSFGYLKNLKVDYLKIDGIFVKDIADDPIDHAMVKSINDIGHVMGMKTIAEFVESKKIKGMLRKLGVDYAQGYEIGRPQPFEEILVDKKELKAS
ncbi:MAG: EAL domain-containing protein, partial [Gammaproteobacteria bacterium]